MVELPHIKVTEANTGLVIVEVEDTELFDFIDDYLTEKYGIQHEYHTENQDINGLSHYKMHFPEIVTKNAIEEALNILSRDEIERIFRINNPR